MQVSYEQTKNSLAAFIYTNDFAPTLYIEGEISTNNERPIVSLERKVPQGIVEQNLLLVFRPDIYDPEGPGKLKIRNFEEPMTSSEQYTSVTIEADNGTISLSVEKRSRS